METYYEQLLERSNVIRNRITNDIVMLEEAHLTWKKTPKQWSIIEVVDHLNKVYDIYEPNFRKAIDTAPSLNGQQQKEQHTLLGRLSIYSMRPKKDKRKFKMKTFSFFEPTVENSPNKVIAAYESKKNTFNGFMKEARLKNLNNQKMPTALGEKMKFYVAECFDFILAHEERHLVQMEKLVAQIKSPNVLT